MPGRTDDPMNPSWTREEQESEVTRKMREIVSGFEEMSLWEPARPIHLLVEEMFGEPPLFSKRVHPGPGFPYRAMTEDEVRVLARGVGQMISNAQKAEEDAFRRSDSEMDCYYRGQATKLLDVLKLLEKVLRGEWPRSDA